MGENAATRNHNNHQAFGVVSIDVPSQDTSECFDDDGRIKRTGTVWTASAHIITAVIGSGVLSLAWAIAQLGWIAGPAVMFLFSFVTCYTSSLLSECYRTGDSVSGKRNYTYMDAVRSILGGYKVKACGLIQYLNLFGISIGYTIAASISMMAIKRSNCFHESGGKNPCHMSSNIYMIMFGVSEILLSQIPDFDQIWWLSIVAAVMSFTYSGIGLGLGIAKVAENGGFRGSLTGISIGTVTQAQKIWRSFQALGDIAFAYSFSVILIEIQDTVRSPPAESKTMRKATKISIVVTTAFYMLCGCMGYASFGDFAPGNLLTGFGFYNPFWLLDIANAAIVIHLVGAYQVFCQPIFAFIEKLAIQRWPDSYFITKEFKIRIPGYRYPYKLNLFRLVWRTIFVIFTTVISMLLPFFNDVVGILGALGFWPLTVYFPVEMYIQQKKIASWSSRWICLKMLSMACLLVTVVALAGSIVGVIFDLKVYEPFKTTY
ncbi:Amino acid transporter, transmembrane [Corchorus capsularis]|uniref:Amino acid transporter, transmembrane n=1 Tax=Corchorus capsularis TaxID=210143 RepID=A0A1R3G1T5_COCAP|nr:Amino acid transporter, transmembrane [Corchorus capsularis]